MDFVWLVLCFTPVSVALVHRKAINQRLIPRETAQRQPSRLTRPATEETLRPVGMFLLSLGRRSGRNRSALLAVPSRLRLRVKGRVLHDSRVTLNTHIDISPFNASNMRLFKATSVGTCLLTDWKANLSNLFSPDSEVVTYRDADECVEKIKYLLEHDDERRAIAIAGKRRTLRDHTFEDRTKQIDAIIRDALTGASAEVR